MGQPVIVPRAEHAISRKQIDPDALKVLTGFTRTTTLAYLVGGSVRDLLLEAAAQGLRHRHVGASVPGQAAVPELLDHRPPVPSRPRPVRHQDDRGRHVQTAGVRQEELGALDAPPTAPRHPADEAIRRAERDRLLHRDNTFGTPEEDAFRRDFTVNALFYDIGSFSIIDYTGGLRDLEARIIRCIGDPEERFQEDPVRMLRAVAMAARLDFSHRSADRRGDREAPRRDRAAARPRG